MCSLDTSGIQITSQNGFKFTLSGPNMQNTKTLLANARRSKNTCCG